MYLNHLNGEIDNAAGLDSRYFWKLVKKNEKTPHQTSVQNLDFRDS